MSRYEKYSPPPTRERWDRDRFETYSRGPPVMERERYEEVDHYSRPRAREASPRRYEEKDRYIYEERDRYATPYRSRGGPGRYYDEEGSTLEQAMVPVRRDDEREIEIDIRRREYEGHRSPPRPSRPTFIRRQSSLDTFDRKPMPRYGDIARIREEVVTIPSGPRRRSPPRYRSPPHYEDYEDIRIQEPERFGDEDYRGYREREISRVRRNHEPEYEIEEREEIVENLPKRGKTKMPMRMINKQAIIQLGYPFEEEVRHLISYFFKLVLILIAGRDDYHP